MPDEADFIRAVIRRPDDDAPRKIYADWLDENAGTVPCPNCEAAGMHWKDIACRCNGNRVSDGRCERAEFIHVQCALAALDAARKSDPKKHAGPRDYECKCGECVTANTLRRRERELLEDGKAKWRLCPSWLSEWLAVLPGKCPVSHSTPPMVTVGKGDGVIGPPKEYHMHRGFVESVTCTAEDWLAHADAILRAQPVREVTLTMWPESWGPYNTRPTAEEWLHSRWPSVKTWHLPVIRTAEEMNAGLARGHFHDDYPADASPP